MNALDEAVENIHDRFTSGSENIDASIVASEKQFIRDAILEAMLKITQEQLREMKPVATPAPEVGSEGE